MIHVIFTSGAQAILEDGAWRAVAAGTVAEPGGEPAAPPDSLEALLTSLTGDLAPGPSYPDPELVVAQAAIALLGGRILIHTPDVGPDYRRSGTARIPIVY